MEPEPVWRWGPTVHVAMETPLDDSFRCGVGLGPPSRAVEVLWHISFSNSEELCLSVSWNISGGTVTLDRKHR